MTPEEERDRALTERDRARHAIAKLRAKIRRIIDRGDRSDASELVEHISAVVGHPSKTVRR